MSASRRTFWVRGGLLTLVVLALLAFTLHSLRLSDASFAAKSANPANVFIAGTLGHVNNQNGRVLITMSGMRPGSSKDGTMTLTGTGDLSGDYTLTIASLTTTPASAPLGDTLNLSVEDVATGDVLFDDPLAALDSVDLGTIAPGVMSSYLITLYYDDGPTNGAAQSASLALTLQVTGVSQ